MTVTRRRAFLVLRSSKSSVPIDEFDEPAVDSRIAAIDREHAMERALEGLPERCRSLLEMLYFDPTEPSYAAVASRAGIPAASIGPTRARCLEKLRKLLSDDGTR
jgi:RNA polymerase sigma factor (sigma-70 family)